ncbi:MAG TPA: DUF1622 domain-containing protein [Acidimicrobiales bacterium]|nr:DUF1622 domain-containing protein [Acidimicrobiales bacterium]
MDIEFADLVERTGQTVELTGIAVIVGGIAVSLVAFGVRWLTGRRGSEVYGDARESIGRTILLGLELLVAGDIIRTVAVSPSFTSVGVLAAVVLIRTFLSFTLELEITGRWPWQPPPVAATPTDDAPPGSTPT